MAWLWCCGTSHKGKSIEEAAAFMPDEVIDCYAAAGTSDEVKRAISRFDGIAESLRVLPPPHVLGAAEMDVYQQRILDVFGH